MNRRGFFKTVFAVAVAAALAISSALQPAWALIGLLGGAVSVATLNPLGINTEGLGYASLEQPWLNAIKGMSAAGAYGYSGLNGPWLTSKSGTNDTGEEAYLAPTLDANGWPTTMTVSGIPGGQQFTTLQSFIYFGYSGTLPPGASQWYPYTGVTWQAEILGQGTMSFVGASSIVVTSGSSYLSVSGTQVTSTLPNGQSATITFSLGSGGLNLQLTATGAAPNNFQIPYIVNQAYLANYNSGEILNPDYKAAITGSGSKLFSYLRTMGWQNTYNQEFLVTFTANLASGATSGTLSSLTRQANSFTTWPFPTGVTKRVVMSTGQVVNMTGTTGSASVTWDTALSAPISTSAVGGMAILSLTSGWSQRQLPGNATWAGPNGPPWEVMARAANELGINLWGNVAAALPTVDTSYLTNLANLLYNGTGASLTGWNVSSFSGLSPSLRAIIEPSNEVWNFGNGYQEANFCEMMGVVEGFYAAQGNNGPYGGAEFYGTMAAGIGDAFYAVYGVSMSSRVGVVMMNQTGVGTGTGFMKVAMNTPDWTSAAYTHHIYGYGIAPYFGPTYNSGMNSTDAGTIAALADPVGELFSLAYTNHGASGNTYSSVPTNGYMGVSLAAVASYIAAFSGQPWVNLPRVFYEGGLDLGNYSGNSALSPYLTDMIRDSRARYLNNDPSHQLSASGTGYLPGLAANGVTFINLLNLCGEEWGQLEVVTQMESMPPYTDAPRYLGDFNYAQGQP